MLSWVLVNIGSGNGLVPGTKPLPEPMLIADSLSFGPSGTNFSENVQMFFYENALENIVNKTSAILFRLQCDKWFSDKKLFYCLQFYYFFAEVFIVVTGFVPDMFKNGVLEPYGMHWKHDY